MSSPISFSGFNNIDFGSIVTALMTQASVPLKNLQTKQTNLGTQVANFKNLGTQLSAVQAAAAALSTAGAITSFAATSSDPASVGIAAGSGAVAGHYDVIVQHLARAQVTASASTAPDANTTVVASGGTLTIGGKDVAITGNVTLQQLAAAINSTADMPVSASVVQSGTNAFRLVLTANASGTANAFTVSNALTGGTGVSFTDTNNDGISGDTAADNAVSASNAALLVNNIAISSASNTLSSVIPGSTLTLTKQDPNTTISVDVAPDSSALSNKVSGFVTAYNNLVTFVNKQVASAASGDASSIGRDPLIRQLHNSLRTVLTGSYATGGAFDNISQVGVEFTQTGTMQFNAAAFTSAVANGTGDVSKLFSGNGVVTGAFGALTGLMKTYTQGSGLLDTAEQQLTSQITRMGTQISNTQARLAIQKAALQAQFTAADQAM
ncbi:MAG: flagellar filament capping protein FliD, partial [Acidobacteriota bacterium]